MPCYMFTYRANEDRKVHFNSRMQQLLIDETLRAAERLRFRPHFVATERTHLHVLLSWTNESPWESLHANLRSSFCHRLDRELRRRTWFSQSCRRKRVKNRGQFNCLLKDQLPQHLGWKWREGRGYFNAWVAERFNLPVG